jgi:hypothetical protein
MFCFSFYCKISLRENTQWNSFHLNNNALVSSNNRRKDISLYFIAEGGGSPNQMYAYNTPPDHWQHAGTSNYNEILCEENYSNKVQGNILAPIIG